MLLGLGCGRRPEPQALPPAESWVGRQVQTEVTLDLLNEPMGTLVGQLPPGRPVDVLRRQADEAGQIWLCVQLDSLEGWLPQERVHALQGEDGQIATH